MHNGRKVPRFRPGIGGFTLEDRIVLSDTGTQSGLWGLRNFLIGTDRQFLYTQYARPGLAAPVTVSANYDSQFLTGFYDLLNTTSAAATTYLANPTGSGVRSTFDTAIKGALTALTAQLTSQLTLIGPSAKGVEQAAQQLILGAGSTSLASVLKSLPEPLTGTGTDATAFQLKISQAIAVTRQQVLAQLDNFLLAHGLTHESFNSDSASGAVALPSVAKQNQKVILNAFAGFANDYALGAGAWLKGSSTSTITTNRAAFNLNAQTAFNSLTSIIASSLALAPNATSDLIPASESRLLGSSGLLSQLNALPNPTDLNGTTAATFGKDAAAAISVAYNDVGKLYTEFATGKSIATTPVATYNNGFGGGFNGFALGYIPQSGVTDVTLNFVPTFLQAYGFTNTLLGLGPNGAAFHYGTTEYGQANGLTLTSGFNQGFNAGFTTATGMNYKQLRAIKSGLF